jgi:hypothetical protein
MRHRNIIAFNLLCLCLVVAAPPSVAQEESHQSCAKPTFPAPPPPFSIERRGYSGTTPPILDLQISVSPDASGVGGTMLSLACSLSALFSKENAINALIFDYKRVDSLLVVKRKIHLRA